ncbi:MAG TPA: response regulator [Bacillota bacterium]|jgi:two-component system response regulator DevR|nr:response regulator [Bacillota bacterium]HOL09890.1 response regulator [Bacillota bacterium]HPO98667.1 response regulator [Bacillota bacterium]
MDSREIKVLIIENDLFWRKLYSEILNKVERISIVGTASNKIDAVALTKILEPDVIIIDIAIANQYDGFLVAGEIGKIIRSGQTKKCKIIMMSQVEDPELIIRSFESGAVEFISKRNYQTLADKVVMIADTISPQEILAKAYYFKQREMLFKSLSNAEIEILRYKREGYTQDEICSTLHKSKNTLKCQVNKLLKKLNVSSCQEAIEEYCDFLN